MAIRALKNDGSISGLNTGRITRIRQPKDTEGTQPKDQLSRLESCVFADCKYGVIEPRPIMAILRFTPGSLIYKKFGPLFVENWVYPDGRKHKYAHALCAYEAGVTMVDALRMDACNIHEPAPSQFFCMVDPTETCILVERGYFHLGKKGLFVRFETEQRGVVHWACARAVWECEEITPIIREGDYSLVGAK